MRLKLVLLFLLIFIGGNVLKSQNINFSTNLPIVFINTNGAIIPDDPRIKAEMEIAWKEDGSENNTTDPRNHFKGDIKIEIRGSSSQMFPKKSYGFELKDEFDEDMDFPILGLPEEEDWILYAPYTDKTLIRNVLALTLAEQISESYASRCRFVELFLNEKYEGVYVLMEKIKRDSVRVDIAKLKEDDIDGEELTGGYIVKIDKKTGGGGDGWHSQYNNSNNSKTFYQYDYPKQSLIREEQKKYIRRYIHDFETAVYNEWHDNEKGFQNYINYESFFDNIVINEISKNVDGYRLSTFLYKDKNDKLNAGPLWDYNLGFGNANYYDGWETHGLFMNESLGNDHWQIPFWWKKLLNDEYFVNPLKCRWEELRNDRLSDKRVFAVADSLLSTISAAVERNYDRWPILGEWIWPNYFVGNDYNSEVNWMKEWLTERLRNLDYMFPGTCGAEPTEPPQEYSYAVFPNPFTTKLQLQVTSKMSLTYRLEVFRLNGSKVDDIKLSASEGLNSFEVNSSNWQQGVYIYRLLKGEEEVKVGKVVKL